MLDNLITDRTAADFQRWKTLRDKGLEKMTEAELAEWFSGMKGAYNATDLNRVGAALNYVKDLLADAGYLGSNEFYMRTDWNLSDIPTASDFTAFIKAVETVRAAMTQYKTTPTTPLDTGGLDIDGANDIEKILIEELKESTLKDAVKKDIAAGKYQPGKRLPGFRELSEKYEVPVIPVDCLDLDASDINNILIDK